MKNNKYLKLITENKSPVKIITEAYDPTKPRTIKFKGIFLVSEKKNGNGRKNGRPSCKSSPARHYDDKQQIQHYRNRTARKLGGQFACRARYPQKIRRQRTGRRKRNGRAR